MSRFALLLAVCAFAADVKPDPPKPMSELHALKLENLVLRQQQAQQALDRIGSDQRALYTEICKAAGIEAPDFAALSQVCSIDLEKRTVSRRTAPVPK